MNITAAIAQELDIREAQVEAVTRLIDEGNTIPFIARYRKEMHGALNDEILRKLEERLNYLRNLDARREAILSAIEEQGKLTANLRKQIEA
ncbi:MAG: RNA-binding transcriptional accessory protein, partial [Lachnospiraceae bacterium]|nr:RNA-binding transcriptional accessory protein [Lachnospiraceae bacterium]